MAKLTTTDLVNLENQTSTVTTINNNFGLVETAMENTLSRDGTTPNTMNADIDMNSYRLTNVPSPSAPTDIVRLSDLTLTYLSNTTLAPTPSTGDALKILKVNSGETAYSFSNVKIDASNNLTTASNDNSSLGTSSVAWSDLFLASGAVINFNAGNYTITHSANMLTFNKSITCTAGPILVTSGNIATENGDLVSTLGDVILTSGHVLQAAGYIEQTEMSAPSAGAANTLRLYTADQSTATHMFAKNSAGTELQVTTQYATAAEMETGTATDRVVAPGTMKSHPGFPKAWAKITGTSSPSISTSFGVTSVSRPALGRILVTLSTAMSSANYCVMATIERTSTALTVADTISCSIRNGTMTTTTFELEAYDNTATTNVADDPASWHFVVFGDQ